MVLILNDVGGMEILLILACILIFFGSKSIPGLAKTLGRTIRQVKDASSDIQNEIKKSGVDIKKDLNLTGILQETAEDIKRPLDQYAQDIDNAVKYQPPNRNSSIPPAVEQVEEPITEAKKTPIVESPVSEEIPREIIKEEVKVESKPKEAKD